MSALVERIIAARDRIKRLINYGEDAVWRPAKEAHEVMADAANALDSYEKTAKLIEEIDRRVVDVLMWLDERGRNSRSFGSHADAYEIAARRLREALGAPEPVSFADIADDGPTAA